MVVHADEACLGNGQEPPTPGGCGGLVEIPALRRTGASAHRRAAVQGDLWGSEETQQRPALERLDYFLSEPDTTNNRMALRSAIAALDLLAARSPGCRLTFVSDSSYLVLGMREWVSAWRARGWKRKGGAIENLDQWQELVAKAALHHVQWTWVRGHAGHPKNEYANVLATRAAAGQLDSGGLVASGFDAWLESERAAGKYRRYDPGTDRAG